MRICSYKHGIGPEKCDAYPYVGKGDSAKESSLCDRDIMENPTKLLEGLSSKNQSNKYNYSQKSEVVCVSIHMRSNL